MESETVMESAGCYLCLGLILGVLIGALISEGKTKRKTALGKINALPKEEEKAKGIVKGDREKRRQGMSELPGAYLLMFLGIALLLLTIFLMISSTGS